MGTVSGWRRICGCRAQTVLGTLGTALGRNAPFCTYYAFVGWLVPERLTIALGLLPGRFALDLSFGRRPINPCCHFRGRQRPTTLGVTGTSAGSSESRNGRATLSSSRASTTPNPRRIRFGHHGILRRYWGTLRNTCLVSPVDVWTSFALPSDPVGRRTCPRRIRDGSDRSLRWSHFFGQVAKVYSGVERRHWRIWR